MKKILLQKFKMSYLTLVDKVNNIHCTKGGRPKPFEEVVKVFSCSIVLASYRLEHAHT